MTQNVDSFEGGRSVVTLEELRLCVTLSNLVRSGGQGTRTLNPLRATHGVDRLANLNGITAAKGKHLRAKGRNLKHYQVSVCVNRSDAFDVVPGLLAYELRVSSRGAFDNMKITRNLA